MSHYCYDFLADSPLFSEAFLNTEGQDIEAFFPILQDYIKHSTGRIESTINEIKSTGGAGIRAVESPYGALPKSLTQSHLMTRLILQDMVIVPDPLFSFCLHLQNRKANAVHSHTLGLQQHNELEELKDISLYMKAMTPFVADGVLRFFPDYENIEGPGIPLFFSPTGFAESFEEPVLEWIQQKAIVSPVTRIDGGLRIHKGQQLSPCRHIHIDFEGSDGDCHSGYTLFTNRITSLDRDSGKFTMTMELPSTPPDNDYFVQWVYQSINQSARNYLLRARKEAFYADTFRASFTPQNDFILGIISQAFSQTDKKSVSEHALEPVKFALHIPELDDVERFLRLRNDTGSLLSFRSYLADRMRSMSSLNDPDDVQKASKEIEGELSRKHLPEVRHALSTFRKTETLKWLSIAAGMGIAAISGFGILTGLATIVLASRGIKSSMEGREKVRSMPGYFWNRIIGYE